MESPLLHEIDESSHHLVRRLSDDLSQDVMSQELQRAKRKYAQGRKLFEQQNYFDSLMKLSKALESFNTMEPPSANLKENLPSLYKTIKDCYVLSASCYIRMD